MTVAEVRAWLFGESGQISAEALAELRLDARIGIRQLASRYELAQARERPELERLAKMWLLEEKAWASGYSLVVGIDEAGCGPLAGPVVAAAVVFEQSSPILGLNDSKQLSQSKREQLFDAIYGKASAVGVGVVSNHDIDEYNILQAAK
ncbi:MAG TPA: ribonuclease HII, partial [Firmicutes bacterium]|nr:ribonuclease HII [Bacillota bacterium]